MTDANPNRILQINQAGDTRALALKVFGGEVLTAFDRTTEFMDKHMVRTITSGKSAQFPVMGRTRAKYHKPGQFIAGDDTNFGEKTITVDDLLISDIFQANVDEALSHYDTRSDMASAIGESLAIQFDTNVARVGILNARSPSTVRDLPGGTSISGVSPTDGLQLRDAILSATQAMDEKHVPQADRHVFVRPAQYYLLVRTPLALDRDIGGEGSVARAKLGYVGGFPVIMTTNLPNENDTGAAAIRNNVLDKYEGDFTNVVALAQHRSAVGTVKLMEMGIETKWQTERQGTLIVGKYLLGHGGLRPEAGVVLET